MRIEIVNVAGDHPAVRVAFGLSPEKTVQKAAGMRGGGEDAAAYVPSPPAAGPGRIRQEEHPSMAQWRRHAQA